MNITVDVQGLKGVENALAEAGPKLAKRVLRKGLTAGGQIMLDAVKALTPVAVEGTPQAKPGELRDSMTMKVKMSPKEESGTVVIGAEYKSADGNQSPGVYDSFVEFGSVHNPATPPKAHMRPGFDSSKNAALETFTEVMRAGVDTLDK
jgi:HK97 gp10 family phage protein